MPNVATHWICIVCREPLGHDGVVLVYNANPALGPVGGYPVKAAPDEPPWADSPEHLLAQETAVATWGEIAEAQVREAKWHLDRDVNVDFGAYHHVCNPHHDRSAYSLPGNLAAEEWMAWVTHLHEKRWMGKWDLHRMLAFYWSHKGAEAQPLL